MIDLNNINISNIDIKGFNLENFYIGLLNKGLPGWFNETLAFWYYPNRQGLTNDTIQSDKTSKGYFDLKDLSKNNFHLKAYNFTGKDKSGMDGYGCPLFNRWNKHNNNKQDFNIINKNKLVITAQKVKMYSSLTLPYSTIDDSSILKIRVKNLHPGNTLVYANPLDIRATKEFNEDGEYSVSNILSYGYDYGFGLSKVDMSCNVEIEILPLYPGALVFDGVDDYANAEGMSAIGTIISDIEDFTYTIENGTLRLGGVGNAQPLYQMLGFNRILTPEEIQWVKDKIIQKGGPQ